MQAACHPDSEHYAFGLCAACYRKEYEKRPENKRKIADRRKRQYWAKSEETRQLENKRRYLRISALPRSDGKRASCHPEKRHYAKGLCGLCYDAQRHKQAWTKREVREKKTTKAKLWYAAHQEHVHLRDIARKFGLAPDEYQTMLDKQQGLCALCGKPPRFRTYLCVDHCHAKQKARALLCVTCNAGLGQFYDDPDLLEKAAAYLRSHAG